MQPIIKFCFHKIIYLLLRRSLLKKEFFIFILIFIVLSLGMHMNQWLTHPIEHLMHLSTQKMPYHPLLYTTIVYLFLGLLRLIISAFMKLFRKK